MELKKLIYTVEDGIAVITMDYMKNLNAIDEQMADELQYVVDAAERDPAVRVVVLKGSIMQTRANEVLTKAADLLGEMEDIGLFGTLERGTFADIKRSRDGGKGLAGVVQKDDCYFNPFIELMKGGK